MQFITARVDLAKQVFVICLMDGASHVNAAVSFAEIVFINGLPSNPKA